MATVDSHIPFRSYLRGTKIAALMDMYAKNRSFVTKAEELRQRYSQLRRHHWGRIETYARLNPRGHNDAQLGLIEAASECTREVRRMADRFGLRCDWGPATIWNYILCEKVRTPDMGFVEPLPLRYTLNLDLYPDDEFKKVLEAMGSRLQRDWPALQVEMGVDTTSVRKRRHPRQLRKHAKWLYQRIALDMTAKEICTGELNRTDARMETIQQAIKSLATELGIKLPRGRPRKK